MKNIPVFNLRSVFKKIYVHLTLQARCVSGGWPKHHATWTSGDLEASLPTLVVSTDVVTVVWKKCLPLPDVLFLSMFVTFRCFRSSHKSKC